MIVTVTSYKGGVGKTAIHLAAYLQRLAPTLLVDGDAIRSATKWSQRSGNKGLPFKVVTHAQMVSHIRDYKHIIIDTEGNPTDDDFKDPPMNCDLLVVPAVPESVATDGPTHTIDKLRSLGNKRHKVLLTMVPPKGSAARAAAEQAILVEFRRLEGPGGITLPGSVWLVSAHPTNCIIRDNRTYRV